MRYKNICAAILVAIMGVIVMLTLFFDDDFNRSLLSTIQCTILQEKQNETISCWYNKNDSSYYLFLPAYADLSSTRITYTDGYELVLENRNYRIGDALTGIKLNKKYQAEFRKKGNVKEYGTLIFKKSEHIDTIHITTDTGSMEYVNSNKKNKEAGRIAVFTSEGIFDYAGNLTYIKGRGNTTWKANKKPYSFQLTQNTDLLNLGCSDSWYLLGNYSDKTNIRNKLVYDFAKDIGLEFSPDTEFVDLYLNHEYMGLYLLSEKVETGTNRVEIGKSGVLLEFEADNTRFRNEKYGITTDRGQKVIVHSEDELSEDELNHIQGKIQEAEDALMSPDGINHKTGKRYFEYFDMNSWALKYILDEVFGNYDCEWSSQFFYLKEDGTLHAGPAWDYDFSMGMPDHSPAAAGPEAYAFGWREKLYGTTIRWYSCLYEKSDFKTFLAATYRDKVQPLLLSYLGGRISEDLNDIKEASTLDAVRWNINGGNESKQKLVDYLKLRSNFLNDVWVNGQDYFKVYFASKTGKDLIYNYAVKSGECIHTVPKPQLSGYSFQGWYEKETGVEFDASKPITKDTVVYAKWTQTKASKLKSDLEKYYEVLPVLLMGMLFIVLFLVDIRFNIPSRKQKIKNHCISGDRIKWE